MASTDLRRSCCFSSELIGTGTAPSARITLPRCVIAADA